MQSREEHEFDTDQNQSLLRLSEELSRFSLATGIVGMALIGLGIAAMATSGYPSPLAGPTTIALGLIAMVGGVLFLRPRASFDWITRSRGGDVTKLIDALRYLDSAHATLRLLLVLFLLVRLASFVLQRM